MGDSLFRTAWLARVGVLIAAVVGTVCGASAKQPHDPNPLGAIESLLGPVEVDRPTLPAAVAEEVAALEARIAELERIGLTAATREEQDAALDEAIGLAERVLALRVEHQGNTPGTIRWSDVEGEPIEWYEVTVARRRVAHFNLLRRLDADDRVALASLAGTDDEFVRFSGEGRYAEAQAITERQLAVHRRVLGDEHPETLIFINNIGSLLRDQGRLAEAEPYTREALEVRRRVLGREHPDTLFSVRCMGVLLRSQGRLAEAELCYREALQGNRRVLGDEHPHTLASISNMGVLLGALGRLVEAEPYYREAMGTRRRVLGDEHPESLISIDNMGGLLRDQGRLAEAEPYTREALDGFRRVLGDEHPHTIRSIGNMGALLRSQGRLAEAEPYTREALGAYRRVLGDEHPNTLNASNNTGFLLWSQGRLAEAELCYREAMEGRRRVLGAVHPQTLFSINNMGLLLEAQGRLGEAEPYFREAMETAERLRIDVIGDAQARAQFSGRLNLPGIASAYARMLASLRRDSEAMGVLERGRARAGLDLLAGGRSVAEAALRSSADPAGVERYSAALASEDQARLALAEAEARLRAAPDDQKAEWTRRVQDARRTLGERTAAVFAEIRGLIPAVDPLSTEQILAGLAPGQALLSFSLTEDGAIALVARDGVVHGFTLASGRDAAAALIERLGEARALISASEHAAPGVAGSDPAASLQAVRDLVLPAELREPLAGATSLTVIPDGPLTGIPMELLIPGTPIAYAPSATIFFDRLRVGQELAARRNSGPTDPPTAIVLGDPIFDRSAPREPEPALPTSGALLTMVAEDGPAAAAGLLRGDVLLTYDGVEIPAFDALGPARAAVDAAIADGSRPADEPLTIMYWREGETLEASLPPGLLGVQLSQAPADEGLRSMRTLDRLSTDRGMSEFAANASALDQIRLYGGALTPLPGTRAEAAAIAALLPGATLLLGEEATAANLTHAVESRSPRYLHLATHGLMGSADRPQDASLALTQPATPTPDDTGFLTLQDLLAQWSGGLKDTDLVVLSACDTGRGVQKGDTLMSLPLGFFHAGAPTVIASLWKVDDQATALLMARLYENLLGQYQGIRMVHGRTFEAGTPMPKIDALDEAKAWLRGLSSDELSVLIDGEGLVGPTDTTRGVQPAVAGGDPQVGQPEGPPDWEDPRYPFAHPRYWAAFVLYGSPE